VVSFTPQLAAIILISNKACNSFTAKATGVKNFINPVFCLFDSLNSEITCNSTGVFDNLTYRSNYCITAYDSCTDTTIRRCIIVDPPPLSVGSNVLISNKTCSDFTATIFSQVGLTNPEFCIYDTANTLITCNTTGVFNNLVYGGYCITIKDGCRDTVITRCFNAFKPSPLIHPIVPAHNNCTNFGFTVDADSLFSPRYCLYDSNGIVIRCNTTGNFDSIPLGDYCVSIYDSCYDTTIVRCFSVGMPIIYNDLSVGISNRTCTTFTVSASGPSLVKAEYCLYTDLDSLVSCNFTGIFNSVPYGNFCVKAHNSCPDTIMIFCFSVQQLVPQVDATVQISNENCNKFTATIKGQQNLSRPDFCLYDSLNNLIECNNTGVFDRILYGKYCIKIQDNCYDTIITRCFERYPQVMDIFAWAGKSCSFNYAFVFVGTTNAIYPVTVTILNPDSSLFKRALFSSDPINIDSLPGLDPGEFYTIIAEDACGKKDTTTTNTIASYFTHSTLISPKCPGATWATGSGNVVIKLSTNMGTVNVSIIKKDNVSYSTPLVPNSVNGDEYTFYDLGPGTYILRSNESICNSYFYDTVTIRPYIFPNLNNSSAYQCDLGGFSVSAIAANGVGPYTYEIIGSTPSVPAIVASPQASTLFSINNGTAYSLVRLRALDACGNATLGDASILPLASNGIYASDNCMWYPATLNVDALYNASYSWYKKDSLNGRDSLFMGNLNSIDIPSVTPADTGTYICYLKVNQGCINRQYNFRLEGDCYSILPLSLKEFKGRQDHEKNILMWTTSAEVNMDKYILERKSENNQFEIVNHIAARNRKGMQQYQWQDNMPLAGNNFYRLKMLSRDGTVNYSNIVLLQNKILSFSYSIYPNPVQNQLVIRLANSGTKIYQVSLYNMMNQLTWQKTVKSSGGATLQFERPLTLQPGMYMIRISTDHDEQVTDKLIFL
ncbi:MAG: T9SS type A sorting domain-containing protein, partial [Panacibacter sp.]